ncbi:MAG: hypothetical protein HUK22_05785, partial [Thermoguttaceae bacterium]|nr:hypothetical protein [Thermoguttaceae bacterium]
MNGINLWASFSRARLESGQEAAAACHFSTVRLHDVPWNSNGQRLVDVHQIFGNLKADPTDPDNYFFKATDDYIANILAGGAVPVYRLGTTIEHTLKPYFAKRPDPESYAEICAAIVRHYNAGWADGFEWNLPYWEIWNEPNLVPQMWDDENWDSYCSFYVVVAKRLRSEFPDIKIGGPALTHAGLDLIGRLADWCKEHDAPLDFVSWHCYARTPQEVLEPPFAIRKLLDEKGFVKTELHLNEWHYFPCQWNEVHGEEGGWERKEYLAKAEDGLHGSDSAAFIGYVLSRWQDTPLTMGNYYAYSLNTWGLFEITGKPRKTYYAFWAFGDLISSTPRRVKTVDGGNVALLAGVGEDGAKKLLVSIYNRPEK